MRIVEPTRAAASLLATGLPWVERAYQVLPVSQRAREDALPAAAKDAVYTRMWEVLSGREKRQPYASRLSAADRQAIIEVLRATRKDLPSYFQTTRS